VEDTVARKAEANLLIRLVDNELIANIQDVPPGILGVTRVHRRRGGRVQKHTSFVVTRLRNWRTSPCLQIGNSYTSLAEDLPLRSCQPHADQVLQRFSRRNAWPIGARWSCACEAGIARAGERRVPVTWIAITDIGLRTLSEA
jgi:hypothetical protein